MKQIAIFLLFFAFYNGIASDLTIGPTITSPVSGCNLSNAETVKITIINADITAYSGTFNVSYTIGSTTVTEPITVPLLPTSTTYIYEFSADVDLSTCGIHDIQFVVSDINDTNPNNDTLNVSITNDCTAAPGTFNGPDNVCITANSGTIELVGNTGVITDWEISSNGGGNWTSLGNTTNTQNYNNLNVDTDYRVIFNTLYNLCPADTTYYDIQIDNPSVAGLVSSDSVHCDTILPTTLFLNNYTGQVLNWQLSVNGGTSYSTWVNPFDTLEYTELAQNFSFFAIVKNGTCPQDSSNVVDLSYIQGSAVGDILGPDTLCTGESTAVFTLNGSNGSISSWSTSIDNGTSWTNLANPTSPMTINNLLQNTSFQVIVKAGNCPADTNFFDLEVIPNSDAGILTGEASYCDTVNNGIIFTDNFNGDILGWLSTTDNGTTYTPTGITNDSLTYTNLLISNGYVVVTKYYSCPADTSDIININVYEASDAGTIVAADSSCPTSDIIWLVANDVVGDILDWQFSIDEGASWQSSFNTSDSFAQIGFNQSILYRMIVQEGICTSDTAFHGISILPEQPSISQIDTLFFGESIEISALAGSTYMWSPDEYISDIFIQTPTFSPPSHYNYTVEITNDYGCSDTSFYSIVVVDNPFGVTPSNLVTPNGDGINENWIIQNIDKYLSNSVTVFDAYGQIIMQQAPYLNDWNLNDIPDGTYFYVIELNSSTAPIKGTFTVLDSQ